MESTTYEFGPYRLNASARSLHRDQEIVPLPPKVIEVLVLLVEHGGEVVGKELFFETVWPGSFVEESNLTQSIFVLRKTLADGNGSHPYIETVPKRGYRFVAPVRTVGVAPASAAEIPSEVLLPKPTESRRHFLWLGCAASLAAVTLVASRLRSSPAGQMVALSVLPFKNLSGDPAQDYLADGLTDTLTAHLGKVRSLQVRSRTSAMRHKDSRSTVRQIAADLGVTVLVEGSVARTGNRVRVVCRLIDPAEDSHLWSETYDRSLEDLSPLLSEIAGHITHEVRVRVSADEQRRLANRGTVRGDAFEACLRGRYCLERPTADSVAIAIDHFKTALRADPACALAYVGLAECYQLLGTIEIAIHRPREARALAIGAARRALEIDPDLAEAYVALAHACLFDWEWAEAERSLRRALELNPSSVPARIMNSRYMAANGRFDEALREIKLARELDPLSRTTWASLAATLQYARRFDDGIAEAERMVRAEPDVKAGYWQLGLIHLNAGRPHLAIPALERARQLSKSRFTDLGFLAQAYAGVGRRSEAVAILNKLLELQQHSYVTPCLLALINLSLKDRGEFFRWYEKSFEERSSGMVWTKVEALYDPVRDDPRFQQTESLIFRRGV